MNFEAGYPPNINIISLNIIDPQKVVADSLSTLNTHNRHHKVPGINKAPQARGTGHRAKKVEDEVEVEKKVAIENLLTLALTLG